MSSAVCAAALVVTKRHSLTAAGINALYRRLFERLATDKCRLYIALDVDSLADPVASSSNGYDDDWRNSLIDYASLLYADSQLSALPTAGGRPDLDVRLLAQFVKHTASDTFSLAALCGTQRDAAERRPISRIYVDGATAPERLATEADALGIDMQCLQVAPEAPAAQPGGLRRKPSQAELLPPPVVQRATSFEGNPIGSAPGVVIGGTFDRLHNGHKMLITTAALVASEQFTCGVTDGPAMLANKVLWELIAPVQSRIDDVRDFVHDIEPNLRLKIVPITDMYGPSVTDRNLDVIVATSETARGADMVNDKRRENGLAPLRHYIIGLADDCGRLDMSEDFKISSWKSRRDMLGTLVRPVKVRATFGAGRYVIGVTGGICSGKTHIAGDLRELGARVVDCDKLGHEAYAPGTDCFNRVVEQFGKKIVDAGTIDRQKLAEAAYSTSDGMAKLSAIVWPEIWNAVTETINHAPEDERVWVLDAAVLLEAGWYSKCDEVWAVIIPPPEAVRRLKERNALSETQAAARLAAQTDNCSRVAAAHVLFSSIWPREQTKMQVRRAWAELHRRISDPF